MRSAAAQFSGLERLAKLIGKSECNVVIRPAGSDVAFLMAVDTPQASQIVYASGGYDVWAWDPGEQKKLFGNRKLQASDLSIEDAAKIVVAEYHLAKAARIKTRYPDLDINEIMSTLVKGYQR